MTNQAGALVGSQGYDVFGAPMPVPTGPAGSRSGSPGGNTTSIPGWFRAASACSIPRRHGKWKTLEDVQRDERESEEELRRRLQGMLGS